MRLKRGPDASTSHLTYCTNIHPGESLAEVSRALVDHTSFVAREFAAGVPFGVGLRLSAAAASEALFPANRDQLVSLLRDHDLYVFTINGFAYGDFHHARVKQQVYRPDWRTDERRDYTLGLARLLSELLPEGVNGTISTAPGGFRDDVVSDDDHERVTRQLITTAIELHRLQERTGRLVSLALEPEPHCQIETLTEAAAFFQQRLFSDTAVRRVASELGLSHPDAETLLQTHLGVCLDTCHAAVEFESIATAVQELRAVGVGVKKMQLSNALRVVSVDDESIERLRAFADDVYLHQVVERGADGLVRFVDLPDAIASMERNPRGDVEWRVHFHIPLYAQPESPLSSTGQALRDALTEQRRQPFTDHLEVETYTWDVLPPALRQADVNASIVAELRFVQALLEGDAV